MDIHECFVISNMKGDRIYSAPFFNTSGWGVHCLHTTQLDSSLLFGLCVITFSFNSNLGLIEPIFDNYVG